MTKTLTNAEIDALFRLLSQLAEKKYKVSFALKLNKTAKVLETHAQEFGKSAQDLLNQHAEKDKKGNFKHPKDEQGVENKNNVIIKQPEAYQKELKELYDDKVAILFPVKFTIDQFDEHINELTIFEAGLLELLCEGDEDVEVVDEVN